LPDGGCPGQGMAVQERAKKSTSENRVHFLL